MRGYFLASLCLILSTQSHAMGPRPQDLRAYAISRYQAGDFAEAEAVFRAEGRHNAAARRAWLGLLFERQGYGAIEAALEHDTRDDEERLWLARSYAASAAWEKALALVEPLPGKAALLLRAQSLEALGSTRAAAAWQAALRLEERQALAPYALQKAAESARNAGEIGLAESRYKRAEQLDQSLNLHLALAQLYIEGGRMAEARIRLGRALRLEPKDQEARSCLNDLERQHPELAAAAVARAARNDAARKLRANPVVGAIARAEGEPLIRVGLLREAPSFRFKTGADTRLDPQGLTLAAGTIYSVRLKGSEWRIESGAEVARFHEPVTLLPLTDTATLGLFDVGFGAGYFFGGEEDRYYRGSFELRPVAAKGVTLVNVLGIESYLPGVLPAEMPPTWPAEALKAQAVAARSETLAKRGRFAKDGYDTCPDVLCAVYQGVGAEHASASLAIRETSGVVLEDSPGHALDAVYMDNSGGHTQDSWDAWAGPQGAVSQAVFDGPTSSPWSGRFPLDPADLLAYLDDAEGDIGCWCEGAARQPYSQYRWVRSFSRAELELSVARRHDIGRLRAVEVLQRSPAGYVRLVRFVGEDASSEGSSDYIRTAIKGLRSNLFYVETRRDKSGEALEFIFHGGGWGHGVGMSQSGAYGLAAHGKGYRDILSHYYSATQLRKRY